MMAALDRKTALDNLIRSVVAGQTVGSYTIDEAALLCSAVDRFKIKDDEQKPKFDTTEDQDSVALNLLIQGAHKAQRHGGCLTLRDAQALVASIRLLTAEKSDSDDVDGDKK